MSTSSATLPAEAVHLDMRVLWTIPLLVITAFAQERRIGIAKYEVPKYPQIARTAHIEGAVVMNLQMDGNGDVLNVEVTSGPPILRPNALAAIKQWRFTCPDCSFREPFVYEMTFDYQLMENLALPTPTAQFESAHRLAVIDRAVQLIDDPVSIRRRHWYWPFGRF